MSHGKLICKVCKDVISQCRCPDHGGNITESFGPCDKCKGAKSETDKLVDRFLQWPLPKSVCSDKCVSEPNYQGDRVGTNLLTADEARQMIEYLFPMGKL